MSLPYYFSLFLKNRIPSQKEIRFTSNCCVFRPANGCSARRSLVKIDFLTLKQLFPSLTEQNKQKSKGKPLKIMQNMH